MVALLFDELMKNYLSVHFKKTFNNYVYAPTVHFIVYCPYQQMHKHIY